jgi:superfamily I DNA/RNA helicase
MGEFEREFKIDQVIRLEQNYRSHGNILDAANALIANNRNRLGKNLWTASGKGDPLRVFEGGSDAEEARFIVEEVRALQREGQSPCRNCRALPLERAVASHRACAFQRLDPVSGLRGVALLRAGRGEARSRLPAVRRASRR